GLRAITDHVVANWDTRRGPTDKENRATLVLALPLTEASAKVRGGPPIDDDEDVDLPHWAGVIPLTSTWGAPVGDAVVAEGTTPPPEVAALEGRQLGD
ncbi:MAG: pyridoxamine 5'-phosphate oxidase family protein, partial [Acidimicrobiales bacterium]